MDGGGPDMFFLQPDFSHFAKDTSFKVATIVNTTKT
jgi:hypothetical protein